MVQFVCTKNEKKFAKPDILRQRAKVKIIPKFKSFHKHFTFQPLEPLQPSKIEDNLLFPDELQILDAQTLYHNLKKAEELQKANHVLDPEFFIRKEVSEETQPEEQLQLGKPLDFNKAETHSFSEWLKLTAFNKIDRSKEVKETISASASDKTAVTVTLEDRKSTRLNSSH